MALLGLGLSLLAFIVLVVIGIIILALFIGALLFFLPAAIIAAVVWFLTSGDLVWTGVAFIAVAILTIIVRR